jgi:hypothetical protein
MAIIPRPKQTVGAQATPLRTVDTGADAVGRGLAQVGEGITRAAQGIGVAYDRVQEEEKQRANDLKSFNSNMLTTEWDNKQSLRQNEYDAGITGDGSAHMATRAAELDASIAELEAQLPNDDRVREKVKLYTLKRRGDFLQASQQKQIGHIDEYKSERMQSLVLGSELPKITADPLSTAEVTARTEAMIAGSGMSDAKQDAARSFTGAAAAQRWIEQSGPNAKAEAEALIANYGAKGAQGNSVEGAFVRTLTDNLGKIEERAKKLQEDGANMALAHAQIAGDVPYNPHDDAQKKSINKAITDAGTPQLLIAGDEKAMQRAVEISQALNAVPPSIAEPLLVLTASREPAKRIQGLRATASILARAPNALDATPHGETLKREATDYAALTSTGLAPDQALARIDETRSPDWKKAEAERKKDVEGQKGIIAKIKPSELTGVFDAGWLSSEPELPALGPLGPAAMSDYKALVQENYIRWGDEATAKTIAAKRMQDTWGVSTVTGRKTLTRFPIERQYKSITPEEIGGELREHIATSLGMKPDDVDLSAAILQPTADGRTERAVRNGKEPPPYTVLYVKDGMPLYLPKMFGPDVTAVHAKRGEEFHAKRDKALAPRPTSEGYLTDDEKASREATRRAVVEWFKGAVSSIGSAPPKRGGWDVYDDYGKPRN